MSDKYFSRVYRGWTLQQTDRGWIIVNAPNRDKSGPISPGPYSTFGIAEHVVDRIMDNSYGPKDNPRNQNSPSYGNTERPTYSRSSSSGIWDEDLGDGITLTGIVSFGIFLLMVINFKEVLEIVVPIVKFIHGLIVW